MEAPKMINKKRVFQTTTVIKNEEVYCPCQITKSVVLPITAIGAGLDEILRQTVSTMVEGKCIVEGFVKPNSVKVLTYSSGLLKGSNVVFDVMFTCDICHPVAGTILNCVAKEITKGGIRAESAESTDGSHSPFVLYVARDHQLNEQDLQYFERLTEGETFMATVIDYKFELNDKYISIIAKLRKPLGQQQQQPHLKKRKLGGSQPSLVFSD
jgi:hypothetical protein